MPVLVKNESSEPWIFDGGRGRQVATGEVQLISDDEWASIITAKRGPGKMHALYPAEVSSDVGMTQIDYVLVGSTYEVQYLGYAAQGTSGADPLWTIKRFAYTTLGADNFTSQIQTLVAVSWDNRASLPWV